MATRSKKSSSKKKTTAKKAAAKKSTAKKSTAKKSTAKKATAKTRSAKKAAAKTSAAKKTTAKKSAAKKTTAKKKATTQIPARKKTAKKKTAAKKTTRRKASARKTVAKARSTRPAAGKPESQGSEAKASNTAERVAPAKATPGKSGSAKPISGKAVPGKSVPGKSVPGKSVPGKSQKSSTTTVDAASQPKKLAFRPGTLPHAAHKVRKLVGVSDIRRFFHRNEEPVFFISATNFNLLNIDEWVHRFRFINYIDSFDGHHPNVFVPTRIDHAPFECLEDVNKYLLGHPEVREYIQDRGPGGKALFLFFDEEIEQMCEELGLEVCFPDAALRTEIDNKINTTRIGNKARVESVPNVLASGISSYRDLQKAAGEKLGKDLVLQTSYGDSGHTTFFVKSRKDFDEIKGELPTGSEEIKIMKRVDCVQAAVEACITRRGTLVGPLMTELVGFPEMTPYRGGWCGNEVFADAFTKKIRDQARRKTIALGNQLAKTGYRGYFEVDYLIDRADHKVYLGEINPRITGASSMTNLAAFAQADAPLFLFHLLEWMGVDFDLDVEELNRRWSDPENIDSWSQMVLKHTDESLRLIDKAPRSGVWGLDEDGQVRFLRRQTHRRTVEREWEGFFLRIANAGELLYEGADLGILITPGRLMDGKGKLTERALAWAQGMVGQYETVALGEDAVEEAPEVGRFKIY